MEMSDMLLQLHKELQPKLGDHDKLQSLLDEVSRIYPIGTYVKVKHTTHIGIVDRYNHKLGGFYPGLRYPIYVYIIYSDCEKAVGNFFEYGANQLEAVDLNELAYNDVLNGFPLRSDIDSDDYKKHYQEWVNI